MRCAFLTLALLALAVPAAALMPEMVTAGVPVPITVDSPAR